MRVRVSDWPKVPLEASGPRGIWTQIFQVSVQLPNHNTILALYSSPLPIPHRWDELVKKEILAQESPSKLHSWAEVWSLRCTNCASNSFMCERQNLKVPPTYVPSSYKNTAQSKPPLPCASHDVWLHQALHLSQATVYDISKGPVRGSLFHLYGILEMGRNNTSLCCCLKKPLGCFFLSSPNSHANKNA